MPRSGVYRAAACAAFLLLPALAVPEAASQDEEAWSQPDGTADAGLAGAPVGPGTFPYADVRSVFIEGEDAVGFWLGVTTAPFEDAPVEDQRTRDRVDFRFAFRLSHLEPEYLVRLSAHGFVGAGGAGPAFTPEFTTSDLLIATEGANCNVPPLQEAPEECRPTALEATFDAAAHSWQVWVPKRLLAGLGPQTGVPPDSPARPPESLEVGPGTFLTGLVVTADHAGPIMPRPPSTDRAPDAAAFPDYPFHAPMANVRVDVTFADAAFSLQAASGHNQTYRMAATNHVDGVRHLHLEYWAVRDGQRDPSILVTGPANLFIPGKQTRYFPVLFHVPADLPFGETFDIEIMGVTSESELDHAHYRAPVHVSAYLGPEHRLMHFHAMPNPTPNNLGERVYVVPTGPAQAAACDEDLAEEDCHRAFFSANPQEEGAVPDAFVTGRYSYWEPGTGYFCPQGDCAGFRFPSPRPIPFGLHLGDGDLTLEFEVSAPQEIGAARFEAQLIAHGRPDSPPLYAPFQEILNANAGGSIGTAPSTVRITAPAREGTNIPMGSYFYLYLNAFWTVPPNQPLVAEQVRFHTAASTLALPIVATDLDAQRDRPESPFWLFLDGEALRDTNAGKTKLFRVGLMNLGTHTDRVRLDAVSQTPDFTASIEPGRDFILNPGDGVTLGIEVRAPADAPVAQEGVVELTATDSAGGSASVTLRVLVVDTDVDDEEGRFVPDPEDLDRLASQGRSPGFAWGAVLVGCVVAIGWTRPSRRP